MLKVMKQKKLIHVCWNFKEEEKKGKKKKKNTNKQTKKRFSFLPDWFEI